MNQEQADAFTVRMMQAFGGFVIGQETLARVSVDLLGIDLAALIPQNSITLGPLVYLKRGIDPWDHVLNVTYACQHLSQLAGRPFEWLWYYAAEPEMRARYIVEAMRAVIEVQTMRGVDPPSKIVAESWLRSGYNLGPNEIALGLLLAERAVTAAKAGIQSTQAARIAIEVLRGAGAL